MMALVMKTEALGAARTLADDDHDARARLLGTLAEVAARVTPCRSSSARTKDGCGPGGQARAVEMGGHFFSGPVYLGQG